MHELQERIDRLRAGESATARDVDRARASAEAQKVASQQARRRLASALAMAESRHRRLSPLLPSGGQRPPASADLLPVHAEPSSPSGSYDRLRDAVVALCLQSVSDGDPLTQQRRRALAERMTALTTDPTSMSWPEAVCAAACELPGVRGAAISTYDLAGVPHPLTATDDWTHQAEELQQVLGEGPGATAHRNRRPVMVARLADEGGRWPGYVTAASGIGVEALWALPIPLGARSLGSVTLHRDSTRPGPWLWQDACTVAVLATSALTVDVDELERGAGSRSTPYEVVDLAAGMAAVQLEIPVEEALDRMRAHAFSSGSRISEVAQAIVDHRLTLP